MSEPNNDAPSVPNLAFQFRASPTLSKLAMALCKAQGVMEPPTKNKTAKVKMKAGGEYSYNYADLADIMAAVRKPLADHELAISQMINGYTLVTILLHSSGEYLCSHYDLARNLLPQEFGSEITYARRYSVCGILGFVAEDDDDGISSNNAQKSTPKKEAPKPTSAPPPVKPRGEVKPKLPPEPKAIFDKPPPGTSKEAVLNEMRSLYKDLIKLKKDFDIGSHVMENYGVQNVADLTVDQAWNFLCYIDRELSRGAPVT